MSHSSLVEILREEFCLDCAYSDIGRGVMMVRIDRDVMDAMNGFGLFIEA